MRILHLIDGGFRDGRPGPERAFADSAAGAAALLGELLDHEQAVCVLGPRRAASRAAGAGARVDGAIAPVLGLGRTGAIAIRRFAAAQGPFDAVQAWGGDATAAACTALGEHHVVSVSMDESFTPGARVIEIGSARKPRRWAHGSPCVTAPPPVRNTGHDEKARERARSALGLNAEETALLLVVSASTAVALRFAFLVSLLAVAGRPVVGLLPGWARQTGRADRFMRAGRPSRIVVTER